MSVNWKVDGSIWPTSLLTVNWNPAPDPPRSEAEALRTSPFLYPLPLSVILTPSTSPAFTEQENVAPVPLPPVNGTSL